MVSAQVPYLGPAPIENEKAPLLLTGGGGFTRESG